MMVLGLRGKLVLALAVMTSLTVLCAGMAIYSVASSVSLLTHVHDATLPSLRSAERLARQSESAIAHIVNLPTVQSEQELDRLRATWTEIDRNLTATLSSLEDNPSPPADIDALTRQISHVRAIRNRLDMTVGQFLKIKQEQRARHQDLLSAEEKFQGVLEPLIAIAERERATDLGRVDDQALKITDPPSTLPSGPASVSIEPGAGPSPGERLTLLLQLGRATGDIVNVLLAVQRETRPKHLQLAALRAGSYAERAQATLPSLNPEVGDFLNDLVKQILNLGTGSSGLLALRDKILASERQMAALRVNASGLFQRLKATIDRVIHDTSEAFDQEQKAFEQTQGHMVLLVLAAAAASVFASISIGAFFVQRRIVQPIVKLSEAMSIFDRNRNIADDLERGPDEIGQLSRSFVDMAHQRRRAEVELTERNQLLATANTELARSNQELDDFAHIAAHDLKEPVRAIQNHARFLTEDFGDQLGEDGKRRLTRMIDLGDRMVQLMNDLLSYAKLGRGKDAGEPVDAGGLITEIEESLTETLKNRNARIVKEDNLPTILGNKAQIATIFRNLINNGVKYNDSEDRVIEIGALPADHSSGSGDSATFYVRDNGIGIDQAFHESVFKMFKRLNVENAYGAGTGAGLSFVQKIVENQGGRIWLTSTPGEGSTFFFTLKTGDEVGHTPIEAASTMT
jgi:signal transduction histidine kinase